MPESQISKRVLVAEDDPAILWMMRLRLERMGHVVDAAEDGAKALALFDHNAYDLVITDFRMPNLDGISLTEAIRAREAVHGERVPVIGISANAISHTVDRALASGMDRVLAKPFTVRQLSDAIAAVMT